MKYSVERTKTVRRFHG